MDVRNQSAATRFRLTRPGLTGSGSKWGKYHLRYLDTPGRGHLCALEIPTATFACDQQNRFAHPWKWMPAAVPMRLPAGRAEMHISGPVTCPRPPMVASRAHIQTILMSTAPMQLPQNPHFNFINPGYIPIQLQTIARQPAVLPPWIYATVAVERKPVLTLGTHTSHDICRARSINHSGCGYLLLTPQRPIAGPSPAEAQQVPVTQPGNNNPIQPRDVQHRPGRWTNAALPMRRQPYLSINTCDQRACQCLCGFNHYTGRFRHCGYR